MPPIIAVPPLLPPPPGSYGGVAAVVHEAQALSADGDPAAAYEHLRKVAGADGTYYTLLKGEAAQALQHTAAQFAMRGSVGQRVRLELLDEAAILYLTLGKFPDALRMFEGQFQAHLVLGQSFPAALVAHLALSLGLEKGLLNTADIHRMTRRLAELLDRTIAEVMRGVRSTQRAVAEDDTFKAGVLVGVQSLAYRLTADGLSAARPHLETLYQNYLAAAEKYHRAGNPHLAQVILSQGILLGMGLGLPWALDAAADRLVFFAAEDDDPAAIVVQEEAIAFNRNKQPREADRVTSAAARVLLGELLSGTHLLIFLQTVDLLAEHLRNDLEISIYLNRNHPERVVDDLRQQMMLAQRQYALWQQTLRAVMPLLSRKNSGGPIEELAEAGVKKLQTWTTAFKGAASAYWARIVPEETTPSQALAASKQLARALKILDWSSPRSVTHLVQVLAEIYNVPALAIEQALLPSLNESALGAQLRADLGPYYFSRLMSIHMQIQLNYLSHRWETRFRQSSHFKAYSEIRERRGPPGVGNKN